SPRARRASWTLVTLLVVFGGKVIPADGPVPGRIPPVIVLHDRHGVLDNLHPEEMVVPFVEVQPGNLARVEQPVVVLGQPDGVSPVAGEVADVVAGGVGEPSVGEAIAAVVGQ